MKSFAFNLLLCLLWGYFTLNSIIILLNNYNFIGLLWLIYNATIALLFLVRVRPSFVSMNPIHWTVALITSFSGFFFDRKMINENDAFLLVADFLMVFALLLGILTVFVLGRSYDFLPALRRVRQEYVYRVVRHPMYLSSIIIKLGYIMKNPSPYNALLFIIVSVLYVQRAKDEESVMSNDPSYADYLRHVKYRFIPGIY
jgi:protein-S-isoprenylcysteine O-methyltransferase Ste14